MGSESLVSLRQIQKKYGMNEVLKGVDMDVYRGDVYGLIGMNGAGKTTLFKIILGLSESNGGTISIFGGQSEKQNRAGRRNIGFFVGANFFEYLSGRDNLDYFRRVKGIKDKKEVDRVLKIVHLDGPAAEKKAGSYSLGMKQRLGIANSLLGNPEMLIMDEPTNGLDPQGIADVRNLITKLNEEEGKTILVSSHILGELEHTAHRFGIVHEGVIMQELGSEELQTKSGLSLLQIADEDVSKAKKVLEENGINVSDVKKDASSLEDFYFNMVGGGRNA